VDPKVTQDWRCKRLGEGETGYEPDENKVRIDVEAGAMSERPNWVFHMH
jgi:hypothetical protein